MMTTNISAMPSANAMNAMGGMGRAKGPGPGHRPAPPSAEQLFSVLDSNSDNALSSSEIKNTALASQSDSIDTNGDGFISAEELKSAIDSFQKQIRANQRQGPVDDRMPPPSEADLLKKMDGDNNGTISAKEAVGPLSERFSMADTDGNGQINLDELTRDVTAARQERHGPPMGMMPPPPSGMMPPSGDGQSSSAKNNRPLSFGMASYWSVMSQLMSTSSQSTSTNSATSGATSLKSLFV
ncbi:MAG: EF-hand domain-containing protein [Magnetococcales bacterium]|nr:EF-hand domain-containing protein [Magnetococcales bacterium]